MASTASSDLGVLRDSWRALAREPGAAGLLVLAGTLLGAVGPLLQRLLALPTDQTTTYLVGMAGMLPMELYFIPRFLLRLDATGLDHPANPAGSWHATFEERWLRTVLAKLGLDLAIVVGFIPFIVPALFVIFAFGWMPMRVLLRGENWRVAARESFALMRRGWRRAILMVSAALTLTFLVAAGLIVVGGLFLPSPESWNDLKHPLVWVFNGISVAVNVWLNATLLAAYQRLEAYSPAASSEESR